MNATSVTVIEPSGQPNRSALKANLESLSRAGLNIKQLEYPEVSGNRLGRGGIEARLDLLYEVLECPEQGVVLCARGGYGASDLIGRLNWRRIEKLSPRLITGFSDISALQSAFHTRLSWPALHGPMPGSTLWRDGVDVQAMVEILRSWPNSCRGVVRLESAAGPESVEGRLFGGCFTVLGDLIGTAYLPSTLDGRILFLEDVNESLPRLLRAWNQWCQAGLTQGLSALVLGEFTHSDEHERQILDDLTGLIQERSDFPVFKSAEFGHVSPNKPLMIGAHARIHDGTLEWNWPEPLSASQ